MFRLKLLFLAMAVTFGHWTMMADTADAGLLRDWLNRRRARRCATPLAAAATPTVGANFAGLQPGQCATTCQQTCARTVVNYVPCTSYRTTYERVPVTQFRPQTTSDPCTGCSVTCMRPCTTYTYRTRRVPYTTYRPVYRQETYRVPVTTITNNCNSGCNTCPTGTCSTGGLPAAGFASPGSGTTAGSTTTNSFPSTLPTDGSFSLQNGGFPPGTTITEQPADLTPSLNPQNSNRSVIESLQGGSSTRAPLPSQQQDRSHWSLTSTGNKASVNRDWSTVPVANTAVVAVAAKSPVTRRFAYTAIKQVSFQQEADLAQTTTIIGKLAPIKPAVEKSTESAKSISDINSAWETVEW